MTTGSHPYRVVLLFVIARCHYIFAPFPPHPPSPLPIFFSCLHRLSFSCALSEPRRRVVHMRDKERIYADTCNTLGRIETKTKIHESMLDRISRCIIKAPLIKDRQSGTNTVSAFSCDHFLLFYAPSNLQSVA